MADPFAAIGAALADDIRARGLRPRYNMYVNMSSWADDAPTFGYWPCPAAPNTVGPRVDEHYGPVKDVTVQFSLVDVVSTRVAPHDCGYPNDSISSNFVHFKRFIAEDALSERASDIYLPGPGLAHVMRELREIPHVAVTASYPVQVTYSTRTVCDVVCLALFSRFGPDAPSNSRTHNAHLLDAPVPAAWLEGKQFGDERTKKRRTKKRRTKKKRTQH
jgi:hypothetical protein